ncbi:MAG TPA: hypothetical protein VEQ60_01710 [Longimicrobium sp.]|nr:hypothetical protein [Longimicrobium sp.]
MAHHLIHEGEFTAMAVSQVAIVGFGQFSLGLIATAVRTGAGNLQVLAWKCSDGNGLAGVHKIEQRGDASSGLISNSRVAIVTLAPDLLVTATRDGAGKLSLTAWNVSQDGNQVIKKAQVTGDSIGSVAACESQGLVVTAVRDSAGNLQVIAWSVAPDGSAIIQRGSAPGGAVGKVTVVGFKYGVVTAARDSFDHLKVIAWVVSANGTQVKQGGNASGEAISDVESAYFHSLVDVAGKNPRAVVTTAVTDRAGGLKVINWSVGENAGPLVTQLSSATGEKGVGAMAMTTVKTGMTTDRLVTAVRASGGNLELRTWNGDGGQMSSESTASAAGAIDKVAVGRVYGDYLVTAVRTDSGLLKLIGWHHV